MDTHRLVEPGAAQIMLEELLRLTSGTHGRPLRYFQRPPVGCRGTHGLDQDFERLPIHSAYMLDRGTTGNSPSGYNVQFPLLYLLSIIGSKQQNCLLCGQLRPASLISIGNDANPGLLRGYVSRDTVRLTVSVPSVFGVWSRRSSAHSKTPCSNAISPSIPSSHLGPTVAASQVGAGGSVGFWAWR